MSEKYTYIFHFLHFYLHHTVTWTYPIHGSFAGEATGSMKTFITYIDLQ